MIYGSLENLSLDEANLPANILEGLRFIANSDVMSLPLGRHDIDGDRIFALVQEYESKSLEDARPEAHKRYLDIQYVAKGKELIGIAQLAKAPAMSEDLLAEKDVCFFASVPDESMLCLSEGSYAVVYPWDVHRPGCAAGEPTMVRKVVVKIAL
nr:YhcH/YjgK/YiaL family protein [uncultured Cohaesibacter sp.]